MTIQERLAADMKDAMRARETDRLNVIRMLRSKIQESEVAIRSKRGVDAKLSEEEAVGAISAYAKQRRDSIAAYTEAGREDLAAKEQAELALITCYLPEQLSEDDVRKIVADAVAESGASSPKEMGAVMQLVMPKVKGRADGKLVNRIVREALG